MPYKDVDRTDEAEGIQKAIDFAYEGIEERKSYRFEDKPLSGRNLFAERDCCCEETKHLLTDFFAILDIEEESMNQNTFHPNHFSSCRVVDGEKMNKIIDRLKILSQQ